jgi:hypothetical protein
VSKKDHVIVEDFVNNMRAFLKNPEIYTITRQLYDRKQEEIREMEKNQFLDISKVVDEDLKSANASRKEWEHI